MKAFFKKANFGNITIFASLAFIDARYGDFRIFTRQGNTLIESTLKNKRVENAPEQIFRTGATYAYKKLTVTFQYNYVSKAFSDANNTVLPAATGVNGLIPFYQIVDISATYKFNERFFVKSGLNNLFNEKHFTRRSGGYPGPGVRSAEPQNFFITIGAKF